ncbi:MAG: glycosyltransferase family 2 protein [Verrucomicrobiota bacterium]|nr:glycosyltransferase family 2 protein [Verrucomicrobiota bacterium]
MTPRLSIVIPFYNEEEVASVVLAECRKAVPDAEIIAVDDGSSDATWATIQSVPGIRCLRLTQNRGQSAAMYAGLQVAKGQYCALMDGDGQNDPADFPALVAELEKGVYDVVCGYRKKRKDSWSRRAASRFANAVRRLFLNDGVRDTGCSLKAFKREAVHCLVPFNGMHRFLPALFLSAGLKLTEVPVNHRPRAGGVSKYTNWGRAFRGLYDLFGVSWLLKRRVLFPKIDEKP